MGKKEYCTFCLEFYRKTISRNWGSGSREIPGCSRCHARHEGEVEELQEKLNSLEVNFEQKKACYETDLANLAAKYSCQFLEQKVEQEKLLAALTLNSSLEVNELKADSNSQRSKVKFLQVRRDSTEGDVVLVVPGLQLSAHCAILAARSAVFRKMIQSLTAEKPPGLIKVDHISPPILEAVVDFCYTGELTFSEVVPPDEVIKVAHKLELECLKELCDAELCRGLTVENVPQMLKLSRKLSVPRLQAEADRLFKNHFDVLNRKVYEVLEEPDTTNSTSESSPGICLSFGEWYDI